MAQENPFGDSLEECIEFAKGKSRLCLQFPDEYLKFSPQIASQLPGKPYIMADTTFGSCCVDRVAQEHSNADGIIHFGNACLTNPVASPPILYVFEKMNLDVDVLATALKKIQGPVLVMTDVGCFHVLDVLKPLCPFESLIWSTIRRKYPFEAVSHTHQVQGRLFTLPDTLSLQDITLFYIGSDSLCLSNIVMTTSCKNVLVFNPTTSQVQPFDSMDSILRRRYVLVQKAKDANVIGIIVGTLQVESHLEMIDRLKKLILAAGKKPYLLAVGKPNPAKLGNFVEVDCFVLIACPQNSLLDSKDYLRPIVTPFELSLALDSKSYWDPSRYKLDLTELLPSMDKQLEAAYQKQVERELDSDPSDEEPEFSLMTGGFSLHKRYVEPIVQATGTQDTLIKRDYSVMGYQQRSAGAEYLNVNRTFQGLEVGVIEVSKVEDGRLGIARGYANEQD